jgi:hypothetical protein
MSTVTGVWSLAVPEKEGARLPDGEEGAFRVTTGAEVSIVNVTGLLAPSGLPSALGCLATAVYVPLASAGVA